MEEKQTGDRSKIIAMWSGPRNVSTALTYSFAQRADTAVWDEPYYAAWLHATGEAHPLAKETIAVGPADPSAVAARILSRPAPIFYQKHMAHHMLPAFDLEGWFDHATHAFLIRPPAEVLRSYTAKYDRATLDLIGLLQQAALFDRAADRLGAPPPVIRGEDIQRRPEAALTALCQALDIPFDAAMLAWPKGPKSYDGAWAPHWYDRVWASSAFTAPPDVAPSPLPPPLRRIAEEAEPLYRRLEAAALKVDDGAGDEANI